MASINRSIYNVILNFFTLVKLSLQGVLKYVQRPAGKASKTHLTSQEKLFVSIHVQDCKDADSPGCTTIVCETGAMQGRDDSALIEIRSRAYANTLIKHQSSTAGYRVRSRAITAVLSLPYGADVRYELNAVDRREVETFVAVAGGGPLRRHIDFWVIALAIVGGCVLLFIIVALLWKCEKDVPLYKATKSTTAAAGKPSTTTTAQYHQVKTDDAYN
jgi:hypothetical protein